LANPVTDFTLKISEIKDTLSLSTGDRMEQSLSKLKALEEFSKHFNQAKTEALPNLLSIFTLSSDDTTNRQAGPKVVIRSIDPLQMTFLFTFEFGET